MTTEFADHLVFVDESGSPGMGNIDPHYPLFVLAFFIVKKSDYVDQIVPSLQQFKFRHFGHDQVILHERDIRKDLGEFSFLKTPALKGAFLDELTALMALGFGLERVRGLLVQCGTWQERAGPAMATTANPGVHVIVEKRGKNEDDDLELQFRRICAGANFKSARWNFNVVFADKKSNSAGLQLGDLVARPIGVSVLKPTQPNRAFDSVKPKFLRTNGRFMGWGLKCFP